MKKNKDDSNEIALETDHIIVDKELAFSKQDYAALVKKSYDLLHSNEVTEKSSLISSHGFII